MANFTRTVVTISEVLRQTAAGILTVTGTKALSGALENIHVGGSRSLRVGARFEVPRDNLSMELSEERHRTTEDAAPSNSIRLDFSIRF